MTRQQGSARIVALVTVGALALAGCGGNAPGTAEKSASAATMAPPAAPQTPKEPSPGTTAAAARGLPDFTDLVARYGPAVVNVSVVERGRPAALQDEEGASPEDPLHDFLRRFGVPPQRGNMPPSRGEGSGFLITPDGYIMTNAHVVEGAGEVTVRTTDRREFVAKIVGVDRRTDVAVIKIDAQDMPTVRLGDPSKLRPGEWVVAIGSPFGFENSVTSGIVSATSRAVNDPASQESNLTPFIQSDAAVNPGNSGGPLFNMAGEVVGINSQIYSRTGGYMGISFAIPIDVAVNVKDQLIKTGRVQRGRIGVQIQEVNQQLADSFGLDRPRGALVSEVVPGEPGAKAGLKAGDVILGVNGRSVERSSDLPVLIAAQKPGSSVELEVWRERAARQLQVQVAELREGRVQRTGNSGGGGSSDSDRLGLQVRPLTQQERRAAEIDGGLLVEDVEGPALNAGLQPGDVIVGANGQKVASIDQLESIVGKSKRSVALLVNRGGTTIFVPLRLGG
jgi:serine protease Do